MAAPIMADAQDLVSTFVLGHASYRTVQELRFPFDCLVRFTVCPPLSLYSAAGLAIGTNTTFQSQYAIRFRGDDHAGTLNTTVHCIICQSFSGSHFYELSGSFPSGRVLAAWA